MHVMIWRKERTTTYRLLLALSHTTLCPVLEYVQVSSKNGLEDREARSSSTFDLDGKVVKLDYYVFFFSSRRRHTRFDCDWSSDVCSSDLCRTSTAAACLLRGKSP